MDKTLQDLAWSILPKEFKEEVKSIFIEYGTTKFSVVRSELMNIFGLDNLTSDAEGEDVLTVPRSQIQKLYSSTKKVNDPSSKDYINGILNTLDTLFGSKCLPDNVDNLDSNVDSLEPKPAELKFKVGDKVFYVSSPTIKHKCTVTKVTQNEHSGKWEYNVLYNWGKPGMWIPESDLEPYTEPQPNCTIKSDTCQPVTDRHHFNGNRNLSQNTANSDKFPNRNLCDKLIRRGFENHNRMHIAAMAMQGILSNDHLLTKTIAAGEETLSGVNISYCSVAKASFAFADALIKESMKGG